MRVPRRWESPASHPARTTPPWAPAAGSRACAALWRTWLQMASQTEPWTMSRPRPRTRPRTGSHSAAAPTCTSPRSSPPGQQPPGRAAPTSQAPTRPLPISCSRPVSVSAAVGRRACWCCPHSSGSGSPSGMMPCAARCSASTPPPARPTSTPRPSTGSPWPSSMRSKPAMAMVLVTLVVLVVRTVLGRCCQWSAGERSPLPGGGSGDCGGCCRRLAG